MFIISYNRPDSLAAVIESYGRLSSSLQLVVCDNGSDDPRLIDYLHALRRSGSPS